MATSISGLGVSESFGALGGQTETVSGKLTGGVPIGTPVTITDNGVSHTANTTDAAGDFSTTFTWNLFQELSTAKPHPVTASFAGTTAGATTFAPSSGSTNAPGGSASLYFQILLDYEILMALLDNF